MLRNVALLIKFCEIFFTPRILISNLRHTPINLSLFRSLEKAVRKLARTEAAIDFINTCLSFHVTPTFARLSTDRHQKWETSTKSFEENCIEEELRNQIRHCKT